MRIFILIIISLFLGSTAPANAQPPIEAYGELPSVRAMVISPNGDRIAYFRRQDGQESAQVLDLTTKKMMAAISTDKVKARSLAFIGQDFLILNASETTKIFGYRGRLEYSAAFSLDLNKNKIKQLLRGSDQLYPAQSGLGYIVGADRNGKYLYMPAYVGSSNPQYSLMKVNIASGKGRVHSRGRNSTKDWIVDADGNVIAREDYDDSSNEYAIWANIDDKMEKIYSEKSELPPLSLVGIKADKSGLIVATRFQGEDKQVLAELSFDGKLQNNIFTRDDAEVEGVIQGENRIVYGVRYSGLYPSYEFFDAALTKSIEEVGQFFPGASVRVTSWSKDFRYLILHVAGGVSTPAYHRFDVKEKKLLKITNIYDQITDGQVGEVLTIEYKARDGAPIPAIATLPPGGVDLKAKRPAIIMPHGGPESYDVVGFDWMAQYFASRGYVVFQPNFRGSDGFGKAFREAGRGQWGRGIMQHDITDGVEALISTGWADADRICIIGASYGGYAALAGGAFTPDLYACVGAIAPVTDLRRMLIDERTDNGRDSWVLAYWKKLIGDPRKEREKLTNISPSEHADAFKAPVLLLHGNDDTVVPYRQSTIMERALKKARKEVTLIKLKGEDHWLSGSETRLATLRALDTFVTQHISAQETTAPSP